jgi:hypothetical protein
MDLLLRLLLLRLGWLALLLRKVRGLRVGAFMRCCCFALGLGLGRTAAAAGPLGSRLFFFFGSGQLQWAGPCNRLFTP